MALPDEKFESDAKRAKSRGLGGYAKDRLTGSADFEKSSGPTKAAPAATRPAIGGANPANKDALEAAGFKRGGVVKPKSRW